MTWQDFHQVTLLPGKERKPEYFGRFHQHLRNTNCNFWMHFTRKVRIMIGNSYLATLAQCVVVREKRKRWDALHKFSVTSPMLKFSRWLCKLGLFSSFYCCSEVKFVNAVTAGGSVKFLQNQRDLQYKWKYKVHFTLISSLKLLTYYYISSFITKKWPIYWYLMHLRC